MSMTVQEPNRAGRAGSRGEAEERMDLVERTAPGAHRALRHPAPAYLDETQIVSPPRVAAGERGGSAVRCCAAVSTSSGCRPTGSAVEGERAGRRLGVPRRSRRVRPRGDRQRVRRSGPGERVQEAPRGSRAVRGGRRRRRPGLDLVPARRGRRGVAGLAARAHRSRPVSCGSSLWAAGRSARDLEQRRQHLDADEAAGTPETELHATREEIASAGADLDHVAGNPARSAGSPANWDA
jgi:hypothetical protein